MLIEPKIYTYVNYMNQMKYETTPIIENNNFYIIKNYMR